MCARVPINFRILSQAAESMMWCLFKRPQLAWMGGSTRAVCHRNKRQWQPSSVACVLDTFRSRNKDFCLHTPLNCFAAVGHDFRLFSANAFINWRERHITSKNACRTSLNMFSNMLRSLSCVYGQAINENDTKSDPSWIVCHWDKRHWQHSRVACVSNTFRLRTKKFWKHILSSCFAAVGHDFKLVNVTVCNTRRERHVTCRKLVFSTDWPRTRVVSIYDSFVGIECKSSSPINGLLGKSKIK